MSRVRITRSAQSLPVQCLDCVDVLSADADRERCRQHVKDTGHTVVFVVEHTTLYAPERDAR